HRRPSRYSRRQLFANAAIAACASPRSRASASGPRESRRATSCAVSKRYHAFTRPRARAKSLRNFGSGSPVFQCFLPELFRWRVVVLRAAAERVGEVDASDESEAIKLAIE